MTDPKSIAKTASSEMPTFSPKDTKTQPASKFVDSEQRGLFKNLGTKPRVKNAVSSVIGESMLKSAVQQQLTTVTNEPGSHSQRHADRYRS